VDSLWAAVKSARSRVANLTIRGLGELGPEEYRKLMEGAQREKEEAERALAARSAPFEAELARSRLGLDDVLSSLPAGATIVAYSRYKQPESLDVEENH
jgi:hypothetical protein